LAGKNTVDVALEAEVSQLGEVVVIGYGTAKKLPSPVPSVLLMDQPLNSHRRPTLPIVWLDIPRTTAIQTSGEPGEDGTTITIRGANTLGDNSPLIVVDGIPHRSLERLDPSDIESITVLKDASAAIYGTQAANGVMLITTKRGQAGKPTITVNWNSGYNQPDVIPKMADAATYATIQNEIAYYAAPSKGRNQVYSATDIQQFGDGSDPWGHPEHRLV